MTAKIHGDDIASEEPAAERASSSEVILRGRVEEAFRRPSSDVPQAAIDEALRNVTVPAGCSATAWRSSSRPDWTGTQ